MLSGRSMTDSGDTTMASAEAADPPFKAVTNRTKTKRLKAMPAQKIAVERTHSFTIRAYFPLPSASAKFNPITNMRALLAELVKSEPSMVVVNPNNQAQLVLSTDPLPTNEDTFKQFFTLSTDVRANKNQQHIIIGCKLLSERTLNEIKFDKTRPQFLNWLTNEKVFIESDALGVLKTTSIGYLTQLHPLLTNRTNLKALLQTALEDVIIDAKLAVELDPELKTAVTEASANGDVFTPEVPPFEIYKTKLIHGRDKEKVETNVLGIKGTLQQARLLKEFFSQLASPAHYEKQIGVFVPMGAVHLLGAANYIKLIRDNNAFIHNTATIPIGDFQHETLDIPFSMDSSTDIDQTTLLDLFNDQPWCFSIDKTTIHNKVMITTSKDQLEMARKWIDETLPTIYSQFIADKIDVTTLRHLTPRRLDKPVLTAASTAYADQLKKRTTVTTAAATNSKQFAKPPRQRKIPQVAMTFDEDNFPKLPEASAKPITTNVEAPTPTVTANPQATPYDYKAEMDRISAVIENKLKHQFAGLFAQMEQRIENLTQQQTTHYAEQQKVNEKNTQQLAWVVDKLEAFFQTANSGQYHSSPSSFHGDGKS